MDVPNLELASTEIIEINVLQKSSPKPFNIILGFYRILLCSISWADLQKPVKIHTYNVFCWFSDLFIMLNKN